jgi:hypothetical protein
MNKILYDKMYYKEKNENVCVYFFLKIEENTHKFI